MPRGARVRVLWRTTALTMVVWCAEMESGSSKLLSPMQSPSSTTFYGTKWALIVMSGSSSILGCSMTLLT